MAFPKPYPKPKEYLTHSTQCPDIGPTKTSITFSPSMITKEYNLWYKDGTFFWTSILKEDAMTKAHNETNRRTVNCECYSCLQMKKQYRFGKAGNEAHDNLIMRSREKCKYQPQFLWIFDSFLRMKVFDDGPQKQSEIYNFNKNHCGFTVSRDKRDFVWWKDKKGDIIAQAKSDDIRSQFIRKLFMKMQTDIHLWELSEQDAREQKH